MNNNQNGKSGLGWIGLCVLFCGSCAAPVIQETGVQQNIPITIQKDSVVQVEMKNLDGVHNIGIRCPPEVWTDLTNHQASVEMRIASADDRIAYGFGFNPGQKGTECDQVKDTHYLFSVSAMGDLTMEVDFTTLFTNSAAELIVCPAPNPIERPW